MFRFSATVRAEKIRRPSGACEMPRATMRWAGSFRIDVPAKVISPRRAGRSPEMARRVVDLPAPFAPISVTISPSSTRRSTSFRAWTRP
jgi:hypothetical protein